MKLAITLFQLSCEIIYQINQIINYIITLEIGLGGEINILDVNKEYIPSNNELIIMDTDYLHSTNTVTSGTKYCYTDYLYEHPGWVFS